MRLGAALIKQAAVDLRDPNLLTAVDALAWWLQDDPQIYLDGLGLDVGDPFIAILEV